MRSSRVVAPVLLAACVHAGAVGAEAPSRTNSAVEIRDRLLQDGQEMQELGAELRSNLERYDELRSQFTGLIERRRENLARVDRETANRSPDQVPQILEVCRKFEGVREPTLSTLDQMTALLGQMVARKAALAKLDPGMVASLPGNFSTVVTPENLDRTRQRREKLLQSFTEIRGGCEEMQRVKTRSGK